MTQITLDEMEASTLTEILESYLSDLRMEVSNTDSKDFRDRLKVKEEFIKRLLSAMAGSR